MRWLVPLLLLLPGCMPYAGGPYAGADTASLEQSMYLGKGALPPRGSPARFTEAQNCGTPDQWKGCPRVLRPSVRVYVDVSSAGEPIRDAAADSPAKSNDPTVGPVVSHAEMPEGR